MPPRRIHLVMGVPECPVFMQKVRKKVAAEPLTWDTQAA